MPEAGLWKIRRKPANLTKEARRKNNQWGLQFAGAGEVTIVYFYFFMSRLCQEFSGDG
jgi:hypothetical protein